MSIQKEAEEMTWQSPPGVTELSHFIEQKDGTTATVMGVVVDKMEPMYAIGDNVFVTVRIRDRGLLPHGIRIRMFRRRDRQNEMPPIEALGDVVLFQNLRLHKKSYHSEMFGVYAGNEGPIPYALFPIDGRPVLNTRASPVSTHEHVWAKSLHDTYRNELSGFPVQNQKDGYAVPGKKSKGKQISGLAESSKQSSNDTPVSSYVPRKDKFSLIKNVNPGQKGNRSSGNFYDLAGEVVKMFSTSYNQMDLYIVDYTTNRLIHENEPVDPGTKGWNGPTGNMALKLELHEPHCVWAQDNVSIGDIVLLRNVRVKWTRQGLGDEIEGNLWSDRLNPDKVCVSLLSSENQISKEILTRKNSYNVNVEQRRSGADSKKSKKKKNRTARQEGNGPKRQKLSSSEIIPIPNTQEKVYQSEDSEIEEGFDKTERLDKKGEISETYDRAGIKANAAESAPETVRQLNSNVKILDQNYKCVPFSELMTLLAQETESSERDSSADEQIYGVKFKVVDFFPHDLKSFCRHKELSSEGESHHWYFWLVLTSADQQGDSSSINVLVSGEDASRFLSMRPCDLQKEPERLEKLRETLFNFWGELHERKDKFTRSHPGISPDQSFSAIKYNIGVDNRPFEGCVRLELFESPEAPEGYERGYKLCNTKVLGPGQRSA